MDDSKRAPPDVYGLPPSKKTNRWPPIVLQYKSRGFYLRNPSLILPPLTAFSERLKTVRFLTIQSSEGGWLGSANVFVKCKENQSILFNEEGEWKDRNLSFVNLLRWTLCADGVSLEHLRFGLNAPVFLVHFVQITQNRFSSAEPHLCNLDRYSAEISWDRDAIRLIWNIRRPSKNESLFFVYK